MKKALILLAAFVGLSFTSCTSQEDNLYSIVNSFNQMSYSGSLSTDAKKVLDEFEKAISAFNNKYSKERSGWVVTIKNGKTSKADSQAMDRYTPMEKELEGIYEEYQTKLYYCSDNCKITYVGVLKLYRDSISGPTELTSHQFSLNYPVSK